MRLYQMQLCHAYSISIFLVAVQKPALEIGLPAPLILPMRVIRFIALTVGIFNAGNQRHQAA
jgi:hypothetical protein